MAAFSVWIIVRDSIAQNEITAELVNSKFAVEALSSTGKICVSTDQVDSAAHILAYKVTSAEIKEAGKLRDKITSILDSLKMKRLAIIVAEFISNSGWQGCNFNIEQNIKIILDSKKDS